MAEGARLESVFTGNRNVGSNPTPSATRIASLAVLTLIRQLFETIQKNRGLRSLRKSKQWITTDQHVVPCYLPLRGIRVIRLEIKS